MVRNQVQQMNFQSQVTELLLCINNTREFSKKKIQWFRNMYKRYWKGRFNTELAAKGFSYLTDEAARDYNNQFKDSGWFISVPARRKVDEILVSEFISAVNEKRYDFMR